MRRVYKLCFLGEEAVGKTSLVQRFVYNRFSEDYKSTIGVSISKKTLQSENSVLDLMLWDLEGSRTPDCFPESYFRGAAGAIVVFDVTRPWTLTRALKFAEAFVAQSRHGQVLLIANKMDLLDDPASASWEGDIQDCGVSFSRVIKTSAKTGDGVLSMLDFLLSKAD